MFVGRCLWQPLYALNRLSVWGDFPTFVNSVMDEGVERARSYCMLHCFQPMTNRAVWLLCPGLEPVTNLEFFETEDRGGRLTGPKTRPNLWLLSLVGRDCGGCLLEEGKRAPGRRPSRGQGLERN